jgi:Matrixin
LKLLRSLPSLFAASFALTISAPGHAFCLTHTCDPNAQSCDFDENSCNIGGSQLYWASSVVTWDVQKDDSIKSGITSADLDLAVGDAFLTWENALCTGGKTPKIKLVDKGPVSCAKPEYNKSQPNQNVITFHDSAWPYTNAAIETLALTTVFFDPKTGEIYDANVEINTDKSHFVIASEEVPAKFPDVDLRAVLTHELGHFLGLSHSTFTGATMSSSYDSQMFILKSDDVAAICASLPPNRMTTDSDEPRHGFSTECGQPQGCCASAIGGRAPHSQALGLWAFGLGVCCWLGRARFRPGARSARAPRR